MQDLEAPRVNPELRELVGEASRALARLDANRLEELALSCVVLNRALADGEGISRESLVRQAHEAQADMAVFARVLEATKANLQVMNRLRELRTERLEYNEQQVISGAGGVTGHGNH
jgi:hypothetical protein